MFAIIFLQGSYRGVGVGMLRNAGDSPLENKKGYQVELTLIRQLCEIPETDENEKNQNFNVEIGEQHCNSDGPNNSYNRQSPMTPGGTRPLNSARFRNKNAHVF